MKRNKLALLSILFISLSANAWESPWAGNWLVGASMGYGSRTGSNQTQFNYNGTLFPASYPSSLIIRDYSGPGTILGLLMGYQAVKQNWLVGAEVNVDHHDMNEELPFAFTDTNGAIGFTGVTNYKRDMVYGLTARAGYAVAPFFMFYVRAGMEWGYDTLSTRYTGNPAVYPYGTEVSTSTWVHRALSGFGAEMPLPMLCGASFRVEYNWHSKSKTLKAYGTVNDGLVSPSFVSTLQPQTHSAKASLIWNFL